MRNKKVKSKTNLWRNVFYALLVLIVLFLIRPWLHPVLMFMYKMPVSIISLLLIIFSVQYIMKKRYLLGAAFIGLAVLSLIFISLNGVFVGKIIAKETEYRKISSMPDSTDIRIVPKSVAKRYLEDSLQKSREKIGELNIVNMDDKLVWVSPRIPDGYLPYLTEKVNGIVAADATKSDRETTMITKKLEIGEGVGITDNIYWNLYKQRFFVDIPDVYYIYKDGNILTIAPIIAYKFRFPAMMPYYDGVFVVSESGEAGYYSPQRVKNIDFFKNNRAYPEELARLYVDSYKYYLGIINAWFLHKDQIEIADVQGQDNQQPFLMATQDGLKWVIATEPYGESYGVFKIFLVDALTGRIDMLELNEDQTLTGPVKIVDYVKKEFPSIDWSATKAIEPRPYVLNSTLYWMMSVTPNDFAGISYTVFVNSLNNKVIPFETEEGIHSFFRGSSIVEKKEEKSIDKRREQLIIEIEERLKELKEITK